MKQLRRLTIVFTLFMAFAIFAFVLIHKLYAFEKRDIVHYNDLLHKVQEDLGKGKDESNVEKKYGCTIIYSTEIENPELAEFYGENALVLDLNVKGEYVGKVVWSDVYNNYSNMNDTFFYVSFLVWFTVLIGGYLFFYSIKRNFIKPVKELKNFSLNIAKGNLDEPLPMTKDNLFGEFVEAFDIMREELKASHEREKNAELARKELVTELSHDIKTPVSVIKATAEVLQMKNEIKTQKLDENEESKISLKELKDNEEKIETISKKAETISALMSNLMHVTLEDMEKLEVHATEYSSKEIVQIINSIKGYGKIIIENDIPGYLIYMDKLRMEQVFDNIISNSFKYAGTDVRVSFLESSVLSEDGGKIDFLKIKVRDSGKGVSEEDLPLLTEKYFRGKNSSDKNGYGLGLHLVKMYMKRMGGGMEYYNDNGFVVELLVKKV